MCGRYSVLTEEEIIEIRGILHDISLTLAKDGLSDYRTNSGEVLPTDKTPILTMNSSGVFFENAVFGFKKWDGKGVIINARSETVQTRSMFSNLLAAGRCVVPAREYYEWAVLDDSGGKKFAKKKTKHFIKDKEGNLLFFAGLYRDGDNGEREFVVITKEAEGDVADIHDRMPVILRVDQLESWLNGGLSPADVVKTDFNALVQPCLQEHEQPPDNSGQSKLF